LITFLALFLKAFGLQGKVPKIFAGNRFQMDNPIHKETFPDIHSLSPVPGFPFMINPAQ